MSLPEDDAPELPRYTGADHLIANAVHNGVTVCFANPGTTELHLVAALDANPHMRTVLCAFEGVVSGAADGYARITGTPALGLFHLGPGFANSLANQHNARRHHSPMLNVIGDQATFHLDHDAPLTSQIELLGDWVDHPRYGRQLKVVQVRPVAPTSLAGLERYLGSGLIPGVGPAIAGRIVAHFGVTTARVLDHEPERLREVAGVGAARAEAIVQAWQSQQAARAALIWLQGHGVSPRLAAKIYEEYGVQTIALVQADPYRPYLPSSPYIAPEAAVYPNRLDVTPEQHLWGPRDYYKSTFYTQHTAHFVSEIGYHGCPNLTSIRRFIDPDHLWPYHDNDQWITHCTAPAGGDDDRKYRVALMANQIMELFGIAPDDLETFILASQISQAEAKKFFIEMTRLKKWRRTGVIWWNLMDGWPQFSDAIVDYYFGKKLAYHYVKRVQQPLCLMVDEPEHWHVRVIMGNDSLQPATGDYRVWDADTGETLLEGAFTSPANANTTLGVVPVSHSDRRMFLMTWTVNGHSYGNHYLLGAPAFDLTDYRRWLRQVAALAPSFDPDAVGR